MAARGSRSAPAVIDREIRCEVARIFAEDLKVTVASDDADLFESGRLDSLGFVELVLQLEVRLGVTVALGDVEFADFRSIDAITAFVMAQRQNGNGA